MNPFSNILLGSVRATGLLGTGCKAESPTAPKAETAPVVAMSHATRTSDGSDVSPSAHAPVSDAADAKLAHATLVVTGMR